MTHEDDGIRDVGYSLIAIGIRAIRPGLLFRSGRVDALQIQKLRNLAILGLRSRATPTGSERSYLHCPFPAESRKYDGRDPVVRKWLRSCLALFEQGVLAAPVLVHCARGTDRTGMLISALLLALKIPFPAVMEEYALSSGSDRDRLQCFWRGLAEDEFADDLVLPQHHYLTLSRCG